MTPLWALLHIFWRNSLPGQINHFCIKMMEAWKGKKTDALPGEESLKEWVMITNEIGKKTGQSKLNFKGERLHMTSSSLNLQQTACKLLLQHQAVLLWAHGCKLICCLKRSGEQEEQLLFRAWAQYSLLRNSFQWNLFIFLSQQQVLSWWAFDQRDDLLGDILHCVLNAILQGEHLQGPWSHCWCQVRKQQVQNRFANEIEPHLPG